MRKETRFFATLDSLAQGYAVIKHTTPDARIPREVYEDAITYGKWMLDEFTFIDFDSDYECAYPNGIKDLYEFSQSIKEDLDILYGYYDDIEYIYTFKRLKDYIRDYIDALEKLYDAVYDIAKEWEEEEEA